MLKLINIILGAACLLILASDVMASTHDLKLKREFSESPRDRIGMREAISIAEGRIDGHAVDATIVDFAGDRAWDVEIASNEGRVRVWVDANSGLVTIDQPMMAR